MAYPVIDVVLSGLRLTIPSRVTPPWGSGHDNYSSTDSLRSLYHLGEVRDCLRSFNAYKVIGSCKDENLAILRARPLSGASKDAPRGLANYSVVVPCVPWNGIEDSYVAPMGRETVADRRRQSWVLSCEPLACGRTEGEKERTRTNSDSYEREVPSASSKTSASGARTFGHANSFCT